MTTLDDVAALGRAESGLAIVSTVRADNTVQSTLVNAGVMNHPTSGQPVLAFVTYGPVKLANLRARPQLTAAFRSGWKYGAVEGTTEIVGPDDLDAADGLGGDADQLRLLLREVFQAAGGSHDDWDEYDRVMRDEGRVAVFVTPTRVYGNA